MLTNVQLQLLQAAVDRIIPTDDYPNGWDAGVGDFYMRLFALEPRFLPAYHSGLDSLSEEALVVTECAFTDLNGDQQDALLTLIEKGDVRAHWFHDPKAFFRLLVQQTTEGFYADPGNGGNKDGIGWAMIGYKVTA